MNQIQMYRDSSLEQSEPDTPHKAAVRAIYRAICNDFGDRFLAQFRASGVSPDSWQWRLHRLAENIEIRYLLDGYEEARIHADGFPPTASSIADEAQKLQGRARRLERERIEAERIAALPPPNKAGLARIEAERKAASKRAAETDGETHAEKMRRLIEVHEANLRAARAAGKICTPTFAERKTCAVPYCEKAGTMSSSVTGSTMWYCSEHFMSRR